MWAMSAPIIRAENLTKRYGDFTAVDGISFTVQPGESFGLLGPNGAGKSTTMRMIGGTLSRTEGTLNVGGLDPQRDGPATRAQLGVIPQQDSLDEELQVAENIYVYGRYFGLPGSFLRERIGPLLEFAQLTDKRKEKVAALSGGMKRRLTIARTLVTEPKILLLDEPTTGLDPQARHILWDRLFQLKEEGVTLVVTTHFMDEAEQLCDRLIVVDKGRIMAEGSPAQLIREYTSREVAEFRFGSGRSGDVVDKLTGIGEHLESLPDRILIYGEHGEDIVARVAELDVEPRTTLVRRSSLEDVFLRLTGRNLIE